MTNMTKHKKGVVIFGSHVLGLVPDHQYGLRVYQKTQAMVERICRDNPGIAIITGGGSGLMEAANKGAKLAGAVSLGYPVSGLIDTVVSKGEEEQPNAYLDNADMCETFEERKQYIMYAGIIYIALPGGYGTLDELFEIITLAQTKKRIDINKIILMDEQGEFWPQVFNPSALVVAGTISPANLELLHYATFDTQLNLFN